MPDVEAQVGIGIEGGIHILVERVIQLKSEFPAARLPKEIVAIAVGPAFPTVEDDRLSGSGNGIDEKFLQVRIPDIDVFVDKAGHQTGIAGVQQLYGNRISAEFGNNFYTAFVEAGVEPESIYLDLNGIHQGQAAFGRMNHDPGLIGRDRPVQIIPGFEFAKG